MHGRCVICTHDVLSTSSIAKYTTVHESADILCAHACIMLSLSCPGGTQWCSHCRVPQAAQSCTAQYRLFTNTEWLPCVAVASYRAMLQMFTQCTIPEYTVVDTWVKAWMAKELKPNMGSRITININVGAEWRRRW